MTLLFLPFFLCSPLLYLINLVDCFASADSGLRSVCLRTGILPPSAFLQRFHPLICQVLQIPPRRWRGRTSSPQATPETTWRARSSQHNLAGFSVYGRLACARLGDLAWLV